jgi:hypothetical protein
VQWQKQQGVKLDVVFNGGGSVAAGAEDPLTKAMVADKAQFRWVNHTYTHAYLGCVQDFTVVPWKCATDANGATQWASQAQIQSQISQNVAWARSKGITVDPAELVTGEHSGLKTLPQMPIDNPNLAPALAATGVTTIASDASRETTSRPVGPATTERRWPMNIYYNVGTSTEEVDEYNWLYTSRADGGSGVCEDNPTVTTCITPLSTTTGFTGYIVPTEARIAYSHVVSADPAPHYAHQSNLAEDRVLYPVLNAVLAKYRATYTSATPVVNGSLTDCGRQQKRLDTWHGRAADVEAYTTNGEVTVINHGSGALDVPLTTPTGTRSESIGLLGVLTVGTVYGQAYGAERSGWSTLGGGAQLRLRLAS